MKTDHIDHILDHVIGACSEHPVLGFGIGIVKGIVAYTLVACILTVLIPLMVVVILLTCKYLVPFSLAIFDTISKALGL